jgi:hypothetical protein
MHRKDLGAIGVIVKVGVSDVTGDLDTHLLINDKTAAGTLAILGLLTGHFRALSIKHNVNADYRHSRSADDVRLRMVNKVYPDEISIVNEPGRDGCPVRFFVLNHNKYIPTCEDRLRKMSEASRLQSITGDVNDAANRELLEVAAEFGMGASVLRQMLGKAHADQQVAKRQKIDQILEDVGAEGGIERPALESLPLGTLSVWAASAGNRKSMNASLVAEKAEKDALHAENQALKGKLEEKAKTALSAPEERFNKSVPPTVVPVPQERGTAEVGYITRGSVISRREPMSAFDPEFAAKAIATEYDFSKFKASAAIALQEEYSGSKNAATSSSSEMPGLDHGASMKHEF